MVYSSFMKSVTPDICGRAIHAQFHIVHTVQHTNIKAPFSCTGSPSRITLRGRQTLKPLLFCDPGHCGSP